MSGPGQQAGVLDRAVVDELRSLDAPGDDTLFTTLIQTFRSDCALRIDELRAALAARNDDGVRTAAHALRGVGAALGAVRVQALAGRIEDLGKQRAAADERTLVPELEREVALALAALRALLGATP